MDNDNTIEEINKLAKELHEGIFYEEEISEILEKISFYNQIGIFKYIKDYPAVIAQNINLSFSRYNYLKENGITINQNNADDLFLINRHFKEKYNITNEELLTKYNYNPFENKAKVLTIRKN